MRIAAVVLAAGRSERMGRPKALLPCRGRTFLDAIVQTLAEASIDPVPEEAAIAGLRESGVVQIRVVLGHDAARVRAESGLDPRLFVENPLYDSGMLSSVQAGIRALAPGVEAFLLWPVDHPLVSAATLRRLVQEATRAGKAIVVPCFGVKRGHPTLFAMRLAPDLLAAPEAEGARAVVRRRQRDVLEVEVQDAGVVTDIDTPEAYRAAFGVPLGDPGS